MPRHGPRRPIVALRLSDTGIEHIDARAREAGLMINVKDKDEPQPNRSEMARIMLAYAAQHMPKGWRPVERSPDAT
jgi:hypothetical protein